MGQHTGIRRLFSHISILQIVIVAFVLVTAMIHLQRGLGSGSQMGSGFGGSGARPSMGMSAPGALGTPGLQGTPGTGQSGRGLPGTPGLQGTPGNGFGQGDGPGDGNFAGPGGFGGGTSLLSILPVSLSVLFILNFAGYLVLVIALYLPFLRKIQRVVRWLLMAFTLLTIVAYFLIAGMRPDTLGIVDKIIEGVLIVLLLIEEWLAIKRERRAPQEPHVDPLSSVSDAIASPPQG